MIVTAIVVGEIMTNCYIVRSADVPDAPTAVIDPGADAKVISSALRKLKASPELIIITHGHDDHIGAIAAMKREFPSAKLCIHRLDAPMLTDPLKNPSVMVGAGITAPAGEEELEEGATLEFGGVKLEVIHTPGHTPGGICLLARGERPFVLFSGDTLFQESVGRTDLPGGSTEELIDGIKRKLLILPDDTKVYPGHGDPSTIGHERKHNEFLT